MYPPEEAPDGEYLLKADPVATGPEPVDPAANTEGKYPPEGLVVANILERATGAVLDKDRVPVAGAVEGAP